MDAEVQSHALRAMTAFIGCTSSSLLKHSLVKDSVSDMLLALEGILQSENSKILSLSVNVTMELVSCLGSSLRHFRILEVIISLSRLLSSCQLPLVISCAIALNSFLTKLGNMRHEKQNEVWEAVEETQVVRSIIHALLDSADGVQPPAYFTEMAYLLKTILWRWPPSRYRVWSNSKLMVKLGDNFPNANIAVSVCILQLLAALALCGDGAMMILGSKTLLSKIMLGMESLQPYDVRCETLILCGHLMRSAEGCSVLTSLHCEPIVQGVISALGGWRSGSEKVPADQMTLLMEACRTASMTRWAGNHHSCFWNLGIDKVLVDILLGNCSEAYQTQVASSSEELIAKIYDNNTNARPYIWDILGWLAIHCEDEFLPKTEGRLWSVHILISCACSVAKDLMRNRNSPLSVYTSELEPVSRAVLLMVFSPCNYISSQARYYLLEITRTDGDGYLEDLLTSLKLKATGDVPLVSDNLQSAVNLITLACYSTVAQYQKLIVEKQGIQMLSTIIKKCLDIDLRISRLSIASHLNSRAVGRICCWNYVGDWDSVDIHLLYSLQALSQLILFSGLVCKHHDVTLRDFTACKVCGNSEARDLVEVLQYILNGDFSPGVKWYAAYILSFFDSYGFPSSLGQRMKRALDENDIADLKLILANGQALTVHGAILVARCPYLLPPEKFLKVRMQDVESTKEHEIKEYEKYDKVDVRMSDRVNYHALIKILEYIYTGTFQVEHELLKPLRVLAKVCGLKSLSDMLCRKLPTWGTPTPSCDFIQSLGPDGYSFSDIILEAKETAGVASNCSFCPMSMPHMHAHKIILCSSCDYLRALFNSGMNDSYSQVIKVPIGWLALDKLITWFYLGKLPPLILGCTWNNMEPEEQLLEMQSYVELASLAEYWFLDEVGEESLKIVVSSMKSSQKLCIGIIQFAVELGQWKLVKAAVCNLAPFYPKVRSSGNFENLDEEVVDMLRAEYVRYSQEGIDQSD